MLENTNDMFDSAEESGPRVVRESPESVEPAEGAVAKGTMVGLAPVLPSVPPPVRPRSDSIQPMPMVKVGPQTESFGPALPVRRALFNGGQTKVGLAAPSAPQLIKQREFVVEEPDPPTVRKAVPAEDSPALLEGSRWVPERAEAQATKPAAARPALRAARAILGRYELVGRIAEGGMGVVYLCRVTGEAGFHRLFAMKILKRYLCRDQHATHMFLREARVACRIYDPHVVGVVDVGMHGEQPFLVMDYVEGPSLHELLTRCPAPRPPRLIVPIVLDALSGLCAMHSLTGDDGTPLNLVHCDVSPHNMLVGVDGTCRLSDFGIAKAAVSRHSGMSYGKPGYFSPEQVGRKAMDQRADLFSMGIVLWNALTGERLFDGSTVEEVFDRVLGLPIPAPSTVGLLPPECFDAICLKALARNPADRYQSAEEMLNELRETAMKNGLLGSRAEVAAWVQKMFGRELEVRRLDAIDAFRSVPGGAENAFAKTTVLPAAPAARSMHTRHASSEQPMDRTVVLPTQRAAWVPPKWLAFDLEGAKILHAKLRSSKFSLPRWLPREWKLNRKRSTIILASVVVAVALIALALLWPAALGKLFGIDRTTHVSESSRTLGQSELSARSSPLTPAFNTFEET